MRRCRPNLTLSYCASSFSVSAIYLNLLTIFLSSHTAGNLCEYQQPFSIFLIIFLSPWIADNLSHQVEMATCHGQGGEQDWAHTKEGKIIHKVRVKNKQTKEFTFKENICSGDEKVLGRRPRSINGPALRGSLSKHPITGGTLKRGKQRFFTWFCYFIFLWHCPLFAGLVLWPLSKLAPATSLARLAFLKYVILARGCASPSCGLSPSQVPRPTCQCHFRRDPV